MAGTIVRYKASSTALLPDCLPSTTDDSYANMDLLDECINIKVGKTGKSKVFSLHKGLLTYHSGWFRESCNENKKGVIRLPEEDPEICTLFRNWLYGQLNSETRKKPDDPEYKLTYNELIGLWNFADRRDIPLLMNRVTDLMVTKIFRRDFLDYHDLKDIFVTTEDDSLLRELAVWQVRNWPHTLRQDERRWKKSFDDDWFKELGAQLLENMVTDDPFRRDDRNTLASFDQCQFHLHETDVRCLRTGFHRY